MWAAQSSCLFWRLSCEVDKTIVVPGHLVGKIIGEPREKSFH